MVHKIKADLALEVDKEKIFWVVCVGIFGPKFDCPLTCNVSFSTSFTLNSVFCSIVWIVLIGRSRV